MKKGTSTSTDSILTKEMVTGTKSMAMPIGRGEHRAIASSKVKAANVEVGEMLADPPATTMTRPVEKEIQRTTKTRVTSTSNIETAERTLAFFVAVCATQICATIAAPLQTATINS